MGLGMVLHKASELGKVDVVSYLINETAKQFVKDANGRTAVDSARMLNKLEVVKVEVLEKGK